MLWCQPKRTSACSINKNTKSIVKVSAHNGRRPIKIQKYKQQPEKVKQTKQSVEMQIKGHAQGEGKKKERKIQKEEKKLTLTPQYRCPPLTTTHTQFARETMSRTKNIHQC